MPDHPNVVTKPTMGIRSALNKLFVPFGLKLSFTQATSYDFQTLPNIRKWIGNRLGEQPPLISRKKPNLVNQTVKYQVGKTISEKSSPPEGCLRVTMTPNEVAHPWSIN